MQLQNSRSLQGAVAMRDASLYTSAWDCAKKTLARSGPLGLYVGISPWLTFAMPRVALRFAAYEYLRQELHTIESNDWSLTPKRRDELDLADVKMAPPSRTVMMLSGMLAGIVEGIFGVCPMQTIQIKMSHDSFAAAPRIHGSMLKALKVIYADYGLRGFWSGLGPTVVKQGINHSIRFTCFNELKRLRIDQKKAAGEKNSSLGIPETLLFGMAAGAVSAFASHPVDTVKSNMQGLDASRYRSSFHCASVILASMGPLGFYKGIGPRLTRVCGEVGLQFALFEQISKVLTRVWPSSTQ